ncbi:hypothetical protein KTS45_10265 [Halomicroarcula limicola]|uniref:DUF8048 domain-containing protein n=1 Tax=Haloarcula limicola TaxID=1429915 RepID=A0A8J8C3J9_9EURY|nr:hypothetical protein [Halomicroarcula limicola]MBV0924581.1 hypothetical protein [Halomicroarcula limicola]
MTSEDTTANEVAIDEARIDHAAETVGVDREALADALVVFHPELLGRHSGFESEPYVTVDGVRAYRVPESAADELLADFDFDEGVASAVKLAHTEQAELLFADAVQGDDDFDGGECGLVVGIDTAEQF